MKRFRAFSGRLRQALMAVPLLMPFASHAQTEPVIIEAESGTLGENLTTGSLDGATYVTTTLNGTTPPTAGRIASYTVTFPAAGNYELYARYRVGPDAGNDDSWYFGQGFGAKTPEDGNQWALQNTPTSGFTAANATVVNDGPTGNLVFKWVKLTGSQGPTAWVVPEGALTQTFQWGSREDGMFMDKLAFGHAGVCYTVADLNAGTAATGTCPPPPPPDPPPHTRTDPPIATGKDKFLGAAWSPGTASTQFASYWNQITPENGGKWGTVEATRDVMNWEQADAAYALAKSNGFVFKWHTLVWGNQQPNWIAALPKEEQLQEITQWYAAIAERFPDIDQIDVVNEPLHAPPSYMAALGGANDLYGTGWDWIIKSFEMARQYFPRAKLLINDYSITNDGNATTRYLQIIKLLQDRGLIDGIGDQVHAFSTTEAAPMPNHRANLDRLAATGLPIYGTEFDLDGIANGVINHEVQLANYQRVFPVFWEHPAVKGMTIWGYVRGYHWRNAQGDWLMYENGGERPALQWLIKYVQNQLPVITANQHFSVAENAADGTAIGNVVATDADTDQTLSGWQIDGGSGASVFAIDAASGALSVVNSAALDFESTTSYTLSVSVYDGYRRSVPVNVTVDVTNVNDNAPVVTAAQSFAIDGGIRNLIGNAKATDADDTNQAGFTKLQNWQIVGGTGASLFAINSSTGTLIAARPGAIDFRKSSYTLLTQVSDGANTSEPQSVTLTIPNQVQVCLLVVEVKVPKSLASLALKLGGSLGDCRPH